MTRAKRHGNAKLKLLCYSLGYNMLETLIQAILQHVDQPKKDLEHNLRALLQETVSKMDLVSQDEIERQRQALQQANLRLEKLMQHVEALEQQLKDK